MGKGLSSSSSSFVKFTLTTSDLLSFLVFCCCLKMLFSTNSYQPAKAWCWVGQWYWRSWSRSNFNLNTDREILYINKCLLIYKGKGFKVGFSNQNHFLHCSISVFIVIMKWRCFSLSSAEKSIIYFFLSLSILAFWCERQIFISLMILLKSFYNVVKTYDINAYFSLTKFHLESET